ncbi:hypothetical protein RB195_018049 [Necator americanus]|uniref:Uncharacterized protein n=1 Tax=Necator americanus TaxID=51031 RepID=A0ABR1CB12_NECAM
MGEAQLLSWIVKGCCTSNLINKEVSFRNKEVSFYAFRIQAYSTFDDPVPRKLLVCFKLGAQEERMFLSESIINVASSSEILL